MAHLAEVALVGAPRTPPPLADLSSGSSALALARVARARRVACRVYIPETLPAADVAEMIALGAEVRRLPMTPAGLVSALTELQEEHDAGRLLWLRQNFNPQAMTAYRELTRRLGAAVQSVVAGVGTGASLRAFATHLLRRSPNLEVVAVYSPDIPGLRPTAASMGPGDLGSVDAMRAVFSHRLQVVQLTASQLDPELPSRHGLAAGLSTAAVLHCLRGRTGALGISVDARRVPVPVRS
ncbi:MAG: pyridoxal-phosphate dependent enzyme [Armatimonadetes bacterium]|nr:pyridoxal-phosphate dependent enzyme [Armatimonadota bacterium]